MGAPQGRRQGAAQPGGAAVQFLLELEPGIPPAAPLRLHHATQPAGWTEAQAPPAGVSGHGLSPALHLGRADQRSRAGGGAGGTELQALQLQLQGAHLAPQGVVLGQQGLHIARHHVP